MVDIVEHVDDVSSADAGRIVNAGAFVRRVLMQLLYALIGQVLHVVLAAEVETAGGTRLDTRRLKAGAYAVRAERAFMDLLGLVVELGNVKRTARHAILASDAVVLVEIDNAVCILHEIGRASCRERV